MGFKTDILSSFVVNNFGWKFFKPVNTDLSKNLLWQRCLRVYSYGKQPILKDSFLNWNFAINS